MADTASIMSARTGQKNDVLKSDIQKTEKDRQSQSAAEGSQKHTPIQDYLERSTARRETAIPGSTSSKAKASTAAYVARSAAARAGERRSLDADGSDNTAGAAVRLYVAHPELGRLQESWPEGRASGRSRQKPGKMYDQNAQAIDRTLSDRRKAEKAAAVSKPRGQATKLILALGIIVVLGIGLCFAIPEVTRIQKVTVNGRAGMSEQEIVDALQLTAEVNLVNADLPAMESRILSNPKAASVHISRGFPDRLVIDLTERKPVACVLVSDAAGTRPIAIDAEGVAFAAMDEMSGARKVPILSGIRFENFRPGQRLPSFLQPLLSDIAVLLEENPSVLDAFSEIKVEKIADSDAELVLYPNGKNVPVRMPLRLTKTNLGSALLVLDILSGRPDADMIQELDFRSGTIVYRTKEAQPG